MRAQALITDQEFIRQRRIVADQRDAIQTRITGQTIDVAEVREHFQEISIPLIMLRRTWQTIQPPFRRRFERLILPAGFAIRQSRTAELGGLFSFFGGFVHADSSVVAPVHELSNRIIPDIQGFWRVLKGIEEVEERLVA